MTRFHSIEWPAQALLPFATELTAGNATENTGMVAKSIHPVLDTQAAHFFKIDQVSREQGGFVGEANRGDLEIQRAEAQRLS